MENMGTKSRIDLPGCLAYWLNKPQVVVYRGAV